MKGKRRRDTQEERESEKNKTESEWFCFFVVFAVPSERGGEATPSAFHGGGDSYDDNRGQWLTERTLFGLLSCKEPCIAVFGTFAVQPSYSLRSATPNYASVPTLPAKDLGRGKIY